jgi:hypothetical protein
MQRLFLAILLSVCAFSLSARANDALPPPDQIVLTVTEEAWVETETARVIVQVKSLITDANAGDVAANPLAILDKVALGHWRMTSSNRRQTDTGFEELVIVAEARLAKNLLAGLYDRAKAASEKGRVVQVAQIDFTPSLGEREVTAAQLRQAIYARAAAEAKAVATQFPEQGFRVHQVQFQGGPMPMVMAAQARGQVRTMRAESAKADAGGEQVSERMTLSATVVIAAPGR